MPTPELADLRNRLDELAKAEPAVDAVQRVKRRAATAALVLEAFRRAGLRATVVGGAAIEFHAPGAYTTDDLDLIVEGTHGAPPRGQLDAILRALGFASRSRHWVLGPFFVEVPGHTMDDPAAVYDVGGHTLRLARPEVLLADRVVGFKHWRYTGYGLQAMAILTALGGDLDQAWLEKRLRREDALDAYQALKRLQAESHPVSEAVLEDILDRLEDTR
jgi:hypothetical protein